MRRSIKSLEDEKEAKVPTGRKSRSLFSVADLPLRRSSRINKDLDNSQEPSKNARVTRSRSSTVEFQLETPNKSARRDIRAGSETKAITPGRITRKTRASSVTNTEDDLKASLSSWTLYGTPLRNRTRLSMLPSQPSVVEEIQDLREQKRENSEISVIEIEDDISVDESVSTSNEKIAKEIEDADSRSEDAISSTKTSKFPEPNISTDTNISFQKDVSNGYDENKLINTENENSLPSQVQGLLSFKLKQSSLMISRGEEELTEEEKIDTDNQLCSKLNDESVMILPRMDDFSTKDSSIETIDMVIDEVKTTSQAKTLKPKEVSISVDKTAADRWISFEKENSNSTIQCEGDSDSEIDVCELTQSGNPEILLVNKSAQESGPVRLESDESDVEIDVCDTKSIGKENMESRNAVVVLKDILDDANHKVLGEKFKGFQFLKNNQKPLKRESISEGVNLKSLTPKKRHSLSVDVMSEIAVRNGDAKVIGTREDREKGNLEISDTERRGEKVKNISERKEEMEDVSKRTNQEIENFPERKDQEKVVDPARKDEMKVSEFDDRLETKDSTEIENGEENKDISIVDWNEQIDYSFSSQEEEQETEISVKTKKSFFNLESETRESLIEIQSDKVSPFIKNDQFYVKTEEKIPIETLRVQEVEKSPMETSVPEGVKEIESPEEKKLEEENDKNCPDAISQKKGSESPRKVAESLQKVSEIPIVVIESPRKTQKSRMKELETPRKESGSPKKEAEISMMILESPTKTEKSLIKGLEISEEELKTLEFSSQSPKTTPRKENTLAKVFEDSVKSLSKISSPVQDAIKESHFKTPQTSPNKNSQLSRSIMISPRKLENSFNDPEPEIEISNFPQEKSSRKLNESENKFTDLASKLRKSSENRKSNVETTTLKFPEESSKEEDSPRNFKLQFESESEIGTPTGTLPGKNSEEEDSAIQVGNETSDFEIIFETSKPLTGFPKEKSAGKLNLRSESRNLRELEKETDVASILRRSHGENSDVCTGENLKEKSLKSKSPEKLTEEKEEPVFAKKRQSIAKNLEVNESEFKCNRSEEMNLQEFESGDENESIEEIDALESIEEIMTLQSQEIEALKLKKELEASILQKESEVLRLREDLETPKSTEGFETLKSKEELEVLKSKEEFETLKSKELEDKRDKIESKEINDSIVELENVDFKTCMSSASENRRSSIVAGSPEKQTAEKEEEPNPAIFFKDVTAEEFSVQLAKNQLNQEGESEDDLVLLDEEETEDAEPLKNKTFDDSSVLILDQDESERDNDLQTNNRSRVERLSVEFMEQNPEKSPVKKLEKSPKQKYEKSPENIFGKSLLKKKEKPAISDLTMIEKTKSDISSENNSSLETQEILKSKETLLFDEAKEKKTNRPVVRKYEILKKKIPISLLQRDKEILKDEEKKSEKVKITETENKSKSSLYQPKVQLMPDLNRLSAKLKQDFTKKLDEKLKKEKSRKNLPAFLINQTSSEDEDVESIDNDIAIEYNLPGRSFRSDEDPGDECRTSESEDSDSEDEGSLADFIVEDNEKQLEIYNLISESDLNSQSDADLEKIREQNLEVQKIMERIKESIFAQKEKEDVEENSRDKKKKKKLKKKQEETEDSKEVEIVKEKRKKKKKNQKIDVEEEEKEGKEKKVKDKEVQIEEIVEIEEAKSKKRKKKKDKKKEAKGQEFSVLEVKEKKKKKESVLNVQMQFEEENQSKKSNKKGEPLPELKVKKKKNKTEEILVVNKGKKEKAGEILKLKEEKKKKKTEKIFEEPSQFDLEVSSIEQATKKKKKRKEKTEIVQVPESDLQVPAEPKKKNKKNTEFKDQQKKIKDQERKIEDQEMKIKDQERKVKNQERGIENQERKIKDQEREAAKKKKKKFKLEKEAENSNEVVGSLDLPQKRKKQKLMNADTFQESKKPKEDIRKGVKRLSEEIIESLPDLPKKKQKVWVPSLSMFEGEAKKLLNIVIEETQSTTSKKGSTSKFIPTNLKIRKKVLSLREQLLTKTRSRANVCIDQRLKSNKNSLNLKIWKP